MIMASPWPVMLSERVSEVPDVPPAPAVSPALGGHGPMEGVGLGSLPLLNPPWREE